MAAAAAAAARDATRLWRASPGDPRGEEAGEKAAGCGQEGAPTRPPPAPHPRRGCPIAHATLGPRGTQHASGRHPVQERGEGRGGARRGPPSSLRTPPPVASPPAPAAPGAGPGTPGPGQHRGRPTRPQAPVRPPAPEGRGMPGGEDTATGPRAADRGGPDPRSGERIRSGGRGGGRWWGGGGGSRALPLAQPATMSADRRRRRRQSGQRIGAAAGPGERDTPGRGPGEQQTGSGPRRAGGRTERGTDGVQPRDTNATEPAVEAGVAARHREGAWLETTRGKRVGR